MLQNSSPDRRFSAWHGKVVLPQASNISEQSCSSCAVHGSWSHDSFPPASKQGADAKQDAQVCAHQLTKSPLGRSCGAFLSGVVLTFDLMLTHQVKFFQKENNGL